MSLIVQALGAARDLGRLQDIAAVLIRYGFGDLVQRLGLAGVLQRTGKLLNWKEGEELARLKPPQRVRRVLEDLGPTFVKLGQILATRVDLFEPEWLEEFARLQDHAPAVDWEQIEARLIEELGVHPDEIFARVEREPLAAASLGQVHRVWLHDDRKLILKIRRPGIRKVIEADLRLLARLAELVESELSELSHLRPRRLVRQFSRALLKELDFRAECRNAERIAQALEDDSGIVVPEVFWEWTSERMNAQTCLEGIPGRDMAAFQAAGLDPLLVARRGTRALLLMILEQGFFHADPHPGNLIYLEGNQIGLIDFGMVGRLSEQRRLEVAELLHGLVSRDAEAVTETLTAWSENGQFDPEDMGEDVEDFIDAYHGLPLEQLDLTAMIGDITDILRRNDLVLPPDLVLMFKAFITLEGMGRRLTPDFDMAGEAAPVIEEIMRRQYSPSRVARRLRQNLSHSLKLLGELPGDLTRLVRKAGKGRVEVHVDIRSLKDFGNQLDEAASRLTLGIVTAALIIGSAIVMNVPGSSSDSGHWPLLGTLGFIGAAIGGVWLLFSIWRSGRK